MQRFGEARLRFQVRRAVEQAARAGRAGQSLTRHGGQQGQAAVDAGDGVGFAQVVPMRAAGHFGLHDGVRALRGRSFDVGDAAISGIRAVQRRVHAVQVRVQRHQHVGHVVKQLFSPPLCLVDALAGVGRAVRGIHLAQLFTQEHDHRFGVFALPGSQVTFVFGAAALLFGHAGRGDDGHQRRRRQRHPHLVPADEAAAAIGPRIGPRADGLPFQMAAQVIGKRRWGGIPFNRDGSQGLDQDVVQVTGQRLRQPRHAGGTRLRCGLAHIGGPAFGVHDGAAGQWQGSRCFVCLMCRWPALRIQDRVLAGQQQVEQQPQCIHVGGGGDGVATRLLGRGVVRGQHTSAVACQFGGVARCSIVVQQLGYAEVQQLDLALGIHQHVAGLQVTVHNQLPVRVLHGLQHLRKQLDARAQAQAVAVAPVVDALAVHMLQHQVGLAVVRQPGIDQPCDVRMRQPRQDGALAPKARRQRLPHDARVQQLDGRAALKVAVAALGQPHRAHAAFAQRFNQCVGANAAAGQALHGHGGITLQHLVQPTRACVRGQQGAQFGRQPCVARGQRVDPAGALFGGQVQHLVEPGAQALPVVDVDGHQDSRRVIGQAVLNRGKRKRRVKADKAGVNVGWGTVGAAAQLLIVCCSHRRAFSQSRCTVRSDTPRKAAMSMKVSPQKNFRSTSSASGASTAASVSSESLMACSGAASAACSAMLVSSAVTCRPPPRLWAWRRRTWSITRLRMARAA
nr:hypothetical protein [Pseudorhodoferax sp.]